MDGGILIGRDATRGTALGVAEALARLDRLGVESALTACPRALWFDMREGNAEALAARDASTGRLVPMAAINLYGFDPEDGYLESLKAAGHAAILVWSGLVGWDLSHAAFRLLARRCANLNMPLQIVVDSPADLVAAADHAGPTGGPVLVRWARRGGYNNVPDLLAVARDCPNFLFDVGSITQSGGIERVVERLGSERLFVASNMPQAYEDCAYFLLLAANIGSADRHNIGGANLARLFGRPAPASVPEPGEWRRLRDWPKIDTHWHTSGWNVVEPHIAPPALSKEFDTFRYSLVINSSIRALSDDLAAGNAESAAFMDSDPRVRALIVINPLEPETSIAEIERWRRDPRFVGTKTIQDFYGLELDAPGYCRIFDHLSRYDDMPVMAHLAGMKRAAERYPQLGFVAAHSTWDYEELVALPNVWFDIATSTPLRRETDIRGLIDAAGAERVLFSSDGQLMNPAWTLGKLASLGLDDATLTELFDRSARRAFPRLNDKAASR